MKFLSSRTGRTVLIFLLIPVLFISYRAYRSHLASKEKMDRFAEFNRHYLDDLSQRVKERDQKLAYRPFPHNPAPCPTGSRILRQPLPYDHSGDYGIPYDDIRIDCRRPGDFVILMIGDSITGGSAIQREKTFPDLLAKNGPGNRVVINAGFAGASTAHWNPEGALFDRIVVQNEGLVDVVFIMLGGNDILYNRYVLQKDPDPETLKQGLLHILEGVRRYHPKAKIFMTNYPDPTYLGDTGYRAIESLIHSGAVGMLPGPDLTSLAEDRSNFMIDQIHLNEQGYVRAAHLYEDFLGR